MKKLLHSFLFLFLTSIFSSIQAEEIHIAVAANVQFAIKEILVEFKKATGIDAKVTIGSSGKLTAQITNGAPYDVFLSANMKYPETLFSKGLATRPPEVYAKGSVVFWSMDPGLILPGNPEGTLRGLLSPAVKKIAIPNPRLAPYGVGATDSLKSFDLYDSLAPRLVFAESIAQTNQYIVSKNVTGGFTAKSVVLSPEMKNKGAWVELPSSSYKPIDQGGVILKYGKENHPKQSEAFYRFMFSEKTASILEKYGYRTE